MEGRSAESKRLRRSRYAACPVPVLCEVLRELLRRFFSDLLAVCTHMPAHASSAAPWPLLLVKIVPLWASGACHKLLCSILNGECLVSLNHLKNKTYPLEGEAGARSEAGHAIDGAVAAVRLQVDAACVAHDQPCAQHTISDF